MTHPLTDHIIESEFATPAHFVSGSLVGLFTHDDIRNAADWQLERVVEWLEEEGYCIALRVRLMEALRPQEDN